MATKTFLIISVFALFVQCAVSQCMGRLGSYRSGLAEGLALDGPAWSGRVGCGGIAPAVDMTIASSLNAAYGGCLPITSSSAKAPTGLAVTSENAYDGAVAVTGNLPFLGTAGMEGVFPTAGASTISYGCGDGIVAITAESPIDAAIVPAAIAPAAISPSAIAPSMASWGYNGIGSRGCGCGAPYGY